MLASLILVSIITSGYLIITGEGTLPEDCFDDEWYD